VHVVPFAGASGSVEFSITTIAPPHEGLRAFLGHYAAAMRARSFVIEDSV
jgi:hypothetical protein